MRLNPTIPIATLLLTTIKPCVAPNPSQLAIPFPEYRAWIVSNVPTFTSIYDELHRFLKVRKQTCAIGPSPPNSPIQANPQTTLTHYISALSHLLLAVQTALEVAKSDPLPASGDSPLVTVIRGLYDGTWDAAEAVDNVLDNLIDIITDSTTEVSKIDQHVSQFIQIPWEHPTNPPPGHSKPDVLSNYLAKPQWSTTHPPGTVILANTEQKDGWVSAFESIAENLAVFSGFMYGMANSAAQDGLDDAAYAEVLDTPEFNPSYGVDGARIYTAIDLLRDVRDWYECWADPVREVIRLSELVTPLPGSVESEVAAMVDSHANKGETGAEAA
ncbi:hypothetical protein TWF481_001369 [Arthrobotrys musiformis]|uniref:Uncharacterized protein n=1 Tax=Arthrobotrys musiformis TaxID=47236 RepID=A0AAV9WRD0_9PEZI